MTAHPVIRTLHDVGLAAWAGGSLMGAVGLNGAAAAVDDPHQRAWVATTGWRRWAPVNAAAIGAHLIGATGLLITDRNRVRHQKGVAKSSLIKTAATGAGLGVAAWSAVLNQKMFTSGPVPVQGATEPGPTTPEYTASAQRQLQLVQWLNPLVAGSLIVLAAWQSQQQRTREVARGGLEELTDGVPTPSPALALAAGTLALLAARRRGAARRDREAVAVVEVTEMDLVALDGQDPAAHESPYRSTP